MSLGNRFWYNREDSKIWEIVGFWVFRVINLVWRIFEDFERVYLGR